ncbi:MAG: rhodanese-like domain-containing protein [Myxococcales bacterium]|nr:rhodanese-like domain-containing protein [Myxococcales bacterium]
MPARIISSTEAIALLDTDAVFLDVRSVPEFEAGHAPGAYNIPLLESRGGGLVPNAKFADEVAAALPRDRTIVVACKAGGRSAKAAGVLVQLGFERVLDHGGGWSGNATDVGWARSGGPQTTADAEGRSHRELVR